MNIHGHPSRVLHCATLPSDYFNQIFWDRRPARGWGWPRISSLLEPLYHPFQIHFDGISFLLLKWVPKPRRTAVKLHKAPYCMTTHTASSSENGELTRFDGVGIAVHTDETVDDL